MTLENFLVFTMTVGGVGAVLAFLIELIPGFGALKPEIKKWIVVVLCFAVPVVSMSFQRFIPPVWMTEFDIWFKALVVGFSAWVAWVGSQKAHDIDVKYFIRK